MRTALTISAVSHAVLLLWGVVTFVAKPHTAKRDLIAEAIKKDQAKKVEPKKAEAKAQPQPKPPTPPKKDPPPFDPGRIREALVDKREPQRVAATGDAVNTTASLGGAD